MNAGPRHRFTVEGKIVSNCYGKTDRTLAADLGIDEQRASQIRRAILGSFVRFGEWTRASISFAKANGGCWTMWEGQRGRWRPLWDIGDDSEEGSFNASRARNGAINTPIQGTASEFCITSLARLVQQIEAGQLDAQVVLPIHDSIMVLCRQEVWKEVAGVMRATMTDFPWATDFVPLEVDVEVGEKWGGLEKVKL